MVACNSCGSTNTHKLGTFNSKTSGLRQRYTCKDCGSYTWLSITPVAVADENVEYAISNPVASSKAAWSKAVVATEEAKQGNIPEIGLEENLQGLEVTGVTYLKKDENNVLTWVKTKAKANSANMLEEFAERLINRVEPRSVIKAPEVTVGDLLTLYTLTDAHIGLKTWGAETGADWDLNISYAAVSKAMDLAIARAPDSETGFFLQLGDLAHWDGHDAVTPTAGNILDADSRFAKMYDVCVDIHIETIDKLLLKHDKVLIVVGEGNHDLSTSDTLRALVRRYYSKNPRVEVIGGPAPFYAYRHGLTMLGFHHGHRKKRVLLPSHFSQFFSSMWGATTFRYLHSGHLHCLHVEEKNGAVTTQHPTLAAADSYAAHRFDKTLRSINTITYSSKYGMLSQNIIPIELVQDNL